MKTPEQLRELADRLACQCDVEGDPLLAGIDVIATALAQIQRETAEECAGMLESEGVGLPIVPGETKQERCVRFAKAMARKIRRKFGIDLCNRCGKPTGSAEGRCGRGR